VWQIPDHKDEGAPDLWSLIALQQGRKIDKPLPYYVNQEFLKRIRALLTYLNNNKFTLRCNA
jgi:hypothetical protein